MLVMVVLEGSDDHRFVHVEGDASVSHFSPRLSSGDHQHLITVRRGGVSTAYLTGWSILTEAVNAEGVLLMLPGKVM